MNINAVYTKVKNAIDTYGYNVPVYRDIYEIDEMGCKILRQRLSYVCDLKCFIDNYSSGAQKTIVNTNQGVIKGTSGATLYTIYVDEFPLQQNDVILYQDVFYKVKEISNVVHYNLLIKVSLERVDLDGQ